jgi:hypothetical protein
MNERIKELYQKAHDVYQWDYPSSPVDPSVKSVHTSHQFNPEKFAELIVKECASLTLDPMQIDEAQYYHGWLDYRDKILKHFGVK